MAAIKIHAGDFRECKANVSINKSFLMLHYPWAAGDPMLGKSETLSTDDIDEIAPGSEENVKRLGGTVGWGVVGAAVLGPVGLLAGLLAGGRGKDVTFVLKMKDGRKMLATTDAKTFTKLQAIKF